MIDEDANSAIEFTTAACLSAEPPLIFHETLYDENMLFTFY